MNRITTILSPDPPPSVPPSPRSLSLTAPAVTTQRVAQQNAAGALTAASSPSPTPDSPSEVSHTSDPSPRIPALRSSHPIASSRATCRRTTRSANPRPTLVDGIATTPSRPTNRPTLIDPDPNPCL